MGKFALGMDVVHHLREKKNKEVRDNQQKAMKVWNMHNAMLLEVQKVRLQNKDTHQLTMAQLKTMVKWFHCNGDEPMPQKKNELITRYDAILRIMESIHCHHHQHSKMMGKMKTMKTMTILMLRQKLAKCETVV